MRLRHPLFDSDVLMGFKLRLIDEPRRAYYGQESRTSITTDVPAGVITSGGPQATSARVVG